MSAPFSRTGGTSPATTSERIGPSREAGNGAGAGLFHVLRRRGAKRVGRGRCERWGWQVSALPATWHGWVPADSAVALRPKSTPALTRERSDDMVGMTRGSDRRRDPDRYRRRRTPRAGRPDRTCARGGSEHFLSGAGIPRARGLELNGRRRYRRRETTQAYLSSFAAESRSARNSGWAIPTRASALCAMVLP